MSAERVTHRSISFSFHLPSSHVSRFRFFDSKPSTVCGVHSYSDSPAPARSQSAGRAHRPNHRNRIFKTLRARLRRILRLNSPTVKSFGGPIKDTHPGPDLTVADRNRTRLIARPRLAEKTSRQRTRPPLPPEWQLRPTGLENWKS